MNTIVKIGLILGVTFFAQASDIELIQYSDLRLRNVSGNEMPLYKTWTLQGSSGVTITFEQKQVYGSDGCNRYSAPLSVSGNSVKFGAVMATRAVCESLKGSDSKFRRTLLMVEKYRITDKGILELLDESNAVLLSFHR